MLDNPSQTPLERVHVDAEFPTFADIIRGVTDRERELSDPNNYMKVARDIKQMQTAGHTPSLLAKLDKITSFEDRKTLLRSIESATSKDRIGNPNLTVLCLIDGPNDECRRLSASIHCADGTSRTVYSEEAPHTIDTIERQIVEGNTLGLSFLIEHTKGTDARMKLLKQIQEANSKHRQNNKDIPSIGIEDSVYIAEIGNIPLNRIYVNLIPPAPNRFAFTMGKVVYSFKRDIE